MNHCWKEEQALRPSASGPTIFPIRQGADIAVMHGAMVLSVPSPLRKADIHHESRFQAVRTAPVLSRRVGAWALAGYNLIQS